MTTPARYKGTCRELQDAARKGYRKRAQDLTKQATALHMRLFAKPKKPADGR